MPPLDAYRPGPGDPPARPSVPDRYRWDLSAVCGSWEEWTTRYGELEGLIEKFRQFQGTLGQSGARLLEALRAMDTLGALSYRVWYFAALQYDEDLRDNAINGRRQQVQILFARQQQASAWFNPELLEIPLATIQGWMAANPTPPLAA